jgi:hypothetical protein
LNLELANHEPGTVNPEYAIDPRLDRQELGLPLTVYPRDPRHADVAAGHARVPGSIS